MKTTRSLCGRCGGLVFSALVSWLSNPGDQALAGDAASYSCLSFHPGELKWVPMNLMLGVTQRWSSIPSRGYCIRNTSICFMCHRNQDKLQSEFGPLWLIYTQTSPFYMYLPVYNIKEPSAWSWIFKIVSFFYWYLMITSNTVHV